MRILKRDKSVNMTLNEPESIHGIEVKKVPIGQYVNAMRKMDGLPATLIKDVFPDKSVDVIFAELSNINTDSAVALVTKVLTVVPEHLITVLCDVFGLDYDMVMKELTPNELYDIIEAFWRLNDMTDFFSRAMGLIKKMLPKLNTGSKD